MGTYFKFLAKNKFYTFVTIFGFAVSLMFVFLITVYVNQELSVDKFQEKADRIYILSNESNVGIADRIGFHLQGQFPDIEAVVPVAGNTASQPIKINNELIKVEATLVGPEFFNVFSFPLVTGERSEVMRTRNAAVISESFARKVYPDVDPIGQLIPFNDSVRVMVTGVMKDIKNSTIPYTDILLNMDNAKHFNGSMGNDSFSNAGSSALFVLAKPGTDIQSKSNAVLDYFKEVYWIYQRGMYEKVEFVPLRDFYFYETDRTYLYLNQGDKSFVMVLMTVGIIILLFAIFNYINLTVAQTGFRAREMATRNLLGAKPEESFLRLISESVLLNLVSLILGVILAFACVSFVGNLLGTTLYLADFFTWGNMVIMLLLVVVLGTISGLFPAYLISKFKSIDVVKGNFRIKNKMVFSKVFIVIQNVLTIILITASIVIARQVNHMIDAPLGYNNKDIIFVPNKIGNTNALQPLITELEGLASVKQVALSRGTPYSRGNNNTFVYNEKNISLQILEGDPAFFDMMGFEILHDNQLTGTHANYFTEQAYKELELGDEDVSVPNVNYAVRGKIRDFQLGNIVSDVSSPVLVTIRDREQLYWPWNLLVEIQGDPLVAFDQVRRVYENVSSLEFDGMYLEDQIAESFAAQRRLLKIVTVFCGIAVFISMLGLMAISIYFIRQRTREIAVKKVMGSGNEKIMFDLIKSFLLYVLIAFIIALPIAWYVLRDWLSDYSYRISLSPVYFILAGVFCLIISTLTVFWQSYQAATANPVDALKNE